MEKILVSIAIPAYKRKFLKQAIDSVLKQTYKNIELIIVNDSSPEDLDTIINSYHDKRIRYFINKINIGSKDPVRNWNKCLEYAKGEYFSLLCDDDVYDIHFVESMLRLAKLNPQTSVFRCRGLFIDKYGNPFDMYPSSPEWESAINYLWAKVGGYRIQTISEFMYRTDVIKNIGGYRSMPKAWCADEISITEFAQKGGIAHTNDLLTSFRMSGENITSDKGHNIKEKINAENIYYTWVINFIKEEPDWIKQSITRHLKRLQDIRIPSYLQYASLKELLFLWINRHKKKYRVSNKRFMKSIYLRLSYSLLNKN